jgi:uncharacterized protein
MSLNVLNSKEPWYGKGLRFECTGCGQCCTGFPGVVWVSPEEIETIARHFGITVEELKKRDLRRIQGRWALNESFETYDCVYLKGNKCSIYDHRPTQCRTFPWWPQNIQNEEAWKRTASGCEGIRDEAPLVPHETIQKQLDMQTADLTYGDF